MNIRKIVGETAKRARSRSVVSQNIPKLDPVILNCTMDDIKHGLSQFDQILSDFSQGNLEKAYKFSISSLQLSLKIEKPLENWIFDTSDLEYCENYTYENASFEIPSSKTDKNRNDEIDTIQEYSLQMSDRSKIEYDNYENLVEQMAKDTEMTKFRNSQENMFVYDSPLILEMQDTIRRYKEHEEASRHENEYLIANQELLNEKLKKIQSEMNNLKAENLKLKQALSSIDKLLVKLSPEAQNLKKTTEKHQNYELKDRELQQIFEVLKQKENDIKEETNPSLVSKLMREIQSLKSQILQKKTEKAIENSKMTTSKLNKSLYIIEKEWILKEEKSRLRARQSRNTNKSRLSSMFGVSPNSSFSSTSRSISPVFFENRQFTFKSINNVSLKKSQTFKSTEELEYLRRELDSCLEEKSIVEDQLKRVKDDFKIEEKMSDIKAKEEATHKLLEEKYSQDLALNEKLAKLHTEAREIENQKNEFFELKAKILTREETLYNKEKQLKQLEDKLRAKEKEIKRDFNRKSPEKITKTEDYYEQNKVLNQMLNKMRIESEQATRRIFELEKNIETAKFSQNQVLELSQFMSNITQQFKINNL